MRIKALLLIVVLAPAGCSSFPKGAPLIGYDPTPYGDAFRAAAAEAVIRNALGEGYYEAFGDKAYTLSQGGICGKDSLQRLLAMERGCLLLGPTSQKSECRERDLCIRVTLDSELFRDPEIRSAVEMALLKPCDALTPPNDLPYANWPSAIHNPASTSWRVLRCDRHRQVVGSDFVFDEDGLRTAITFKFNLAQR